MTKIVLSVDDNYLKKLKETLGQNVSDADILREALAMFNWAAEKKSEGQVIASVDQRFDTYKEVLTPLLKKVPPKKGS